MNEGDGTRREYEALVRALSPEVQRERRDHFLRQRRRMRRHIWRCTLARLLRLPILGALGATIGVGIQTHLPWLVAVAVLGVGGLITEYILDEY